VKAKQFYDHDVPSPPFGRAMLSRWMLDPAVTYLNHGTVGAPPRDVLAAQQAIRDEIERQPSRVLLRDVSHLADSGVAEETRMRQAAAVVAARLGAQGRDLAFVDNATAGINVVLRSRALEPGDEILLTDHSYPTNAALARFVADRTGAVVRTVCVPYPAFDPAALVDRVAQTIGPRTRIAILEHVTSESALIFPLADMARVCRDRQVAVLGDGAHAPGMLPVNIEALGVDWYAGNLHKWAYAPRSCGILWARSDRRGDLHPPVLSWGLGEGFPSEFDWAGTRDPSPWLAAPAAFAFMDALGADAVRRYNHDLAWRAAVELTRRWDTALERDEASVGSMVTIPLPQSLGATQEEATRLRTALLVDDKIELQISPRGGRLWARISIQIYNDWTDVERLAEAVLRRISGGPVIPDS
jgi:isopenicillin-N epimerase